MINPFKETRLARVKREINERYRKLPLKVRLSNRKPTLNGKFVWCLLKHSQFISTNPCGEIVLGDIYYTPVIFNNETTFECE